MYEPMYNGAIKHKFGIDNNLTTRFLIRLNIQAHEPAFQARIIIVLAV